MVCWESVEWFVGSLLNVCVDSVEWFVWSLLNGLQGVC